MDRKTFDEQLKELLLRLYDQAYLETHPFLETLMKAFPEKQEAGPGRVKRLQNLIQKAIDGLKPPGREYDPHQIEWRPYVILHQRYVEGLGVNELAEMLAISRRQARRDHSRALQALGNRLWEQVASSGEGDFLPLAAYSPHLEPLNLSLVLLGVSEVMAARLQEEDLRVELEAPTEAVLALSDRTILRQVLIAMFNYCLHLAAGPKINARVFNHQNSTGIQLNLDLSEQWEFWGIEARQNLIASLQAWLELLNIHFSDAYPPPGEPGPAWLQIALPAPDRTVVLVVDDQEPALRLYRRYLSQQPLQVTGTSDANQAIELARRLQPGVIMLDVMMPQVDGWEILQALKTDAKTQAIPVLVCSAWADPDLAKSLGAADFLKKPVTQKDLLFSLRRLGLPVGGTPAEGSRAGF